MMLFEESGSGERRANVGGGLSVVRLADMSRRCSLWRQGPQVASESVDAGAEFVA